MYQVSTQAGNDRFMIQDITVRIYPRVRLLYKPSDGKKWGEFEDMKNGLIELFYHLKNYFPKLKKNQTHYSTGYIEAIVDDWFYNRYMICYDHQILIDGKWKNGVKILS